MDRKYWSDRYMEGKTGWDIGYASTPMKEFIDTLEDKSTPILIPGAGNGYEAEYLFNKGFLNTYLLDISEIPLQNFHQRVPDFPEAHLIQEDFFAYRGRKFGLILEQTFFCALNPALRPDYARHVHEMLGADGLLAGLWFDFALDKDAGPPFGGSLKEYEGYLSPYFETIQFGRAVNSIPPRQGSELFGLFRRR